MTTATAAPAPAPKPQPSHFNMSGPDLRALAASGDAAATAELERRASKRVEALKGDRSTVKSRKAASAKGGRASAAKAAATKAAAS